jgi:hypothetical protein
MDEEESIVITLTDEDMGREYARLMDGLPYETPGQLRDAVFNGGEFCHPNCFDWDHPHGDAWQGMQNWLFLMGLDWREVK